MLIANPIFDPILKHLLEDMEIAKGIFSLILEEEIKELSVLPPETTLERGWRGNTLTIFRLDFVAVLKKADGSHKEVLIEFQKARRYSNFMFFKRYLAKNYRQKGLSVSTNGVQQSLPLEIITIYFLGFEMDNVKVPVLKVNKSLHDVAHDQASPAKESESFLDLITGESFFIQIPRLGLKPETRLEKVLMVFSQIYNTTLTTTYN